MSAPLRSPREKLASYYHLARFVDKIRLNQKGQLPTDYQPNFTRGFDNRWLAFAGVSAEEFIAVVEGAPDDATVALWVAEHVSHTPEEIDEWNHMMITSVPRDPARIVKMREDAGQGHRTDVETYFDLIDLDEGRPVPPRG